MLIPHRHPLRRAVFQARYDRFIAELSLDGRSIEAHCVNPGRMEGLVRPGTPAWVSEVAPESPRKLRYTLELLKPKGRYVGVNTNMPNYLAECLLRARQVPGLKRYREIRREVPYGDRSRIDFLLSQGNRYHYLEVKNCHLVYPDGGAYFPDSVSSRAARHLEELGHMINQGHKASVLFTVQRNDAHFIRPSDMHDPKFAAAARAAHQHGVRFLAACFEPSLRGFRFLGLRPVYLGHYSYEPLKRYHDARLPFSGWIRRGTSTTAKSRPVRKS
ncbi:MAG: DNA/RNA nuclease SfsA [Pseudomonadota bacterium]